MRKTLFVLLIAVLTFGALLAQADDTPQAKPQDQVRMEALADTSQAPTEMDLGWGLSFSTNLTAGELCGGVICGRGEYCCNPSCSTCVLIGMSCTQQSCN